MRQRYQLILEAHKERRIAAKKKTRFEHGRNFCWHNVCLLLDAFFVVQRQTYRIMASLAKLRKFRRKVDGLSSPIKESLKRIGELDRDCRTKQRFVEGLAIPTVQAWTETRRDVRQRRYRLLKVR